MKILISNLIEIKIEHSEVIFWIIQWIIRLLFKTFKWESWRVHFEFNLLLDNSNPIQLNSFRDVFVLISISCFVFFFFFSSLSVRSRLCVFLCSLWFVFVLFSFWIVSSRFSRWSFDQTIMKSSTTIHLASNVLNVWQLIFSRDVTSR